jgi:hypothetical protein
VIQAEVERQRSGLRQQCWVPEFKATGARQARAAIAVRVVDGKVSRVEVRDASVSLAACIQEQVRGWQFPSGYDPSEPTFAVSFIAN